MKQAYIQGVVTLHLTEEKCTGCSRCIEVCPHGVFEMQENKAVITARDNCMECGACQQNCAFGAVTVKKGVGCAQAMINGIMTKGNADLGTCDCGGGTGDCC